MPLDRRSAVASVAVVMVRLFFFVPLAYLGDCTVRSDWIERRFNNVALGNSKQQVLNIMVDVPSVVEKSGTLYFRKYGGTSCDSPCAERLWFENSLNYDLEAWSIELDANGKVINKHHWVLP